MIEGGESIRFYGVIGQIRQVMANLVSNALDASSPNSHVWFAAASNERDTEIAVRDEGVGMNEETRRQLFHPFFSTKGDLGNGLGFYNSKEIVERHGGRLEAESTVGVETTMRPTLPNATV